MSAFFIFIVTQPIILQPVSSSTEKLVANKSQTPPTYGHVPAEAHLTNLEQSIAPSPSNLHRPKLVKPSLLKLSFLRVSTHHCSHPSLSFDQPDLFEVLNDQPVSSLNMLPGKPTLLTQSNPTFFGSSSSRHICFTFTDIGSQFNPPHCYLRWNSYISLASVP